MFNKAFKFKSHAKNNEQYVSCSVEELIALKHQAKLIRYPIRHKSKSHLYGSKTSSLRGRGIDFDEVRAYQPGDEIRSIDWRVTARTGQVHTKVYKEEKEKPVYVLLDLRMPMFFGSKYQFKSVSACHLGSLLAWASLKNGDRFGALIFSEHAHEEIKPKSGNQAALSFINQASLYSKNLLTKDNAPHEVEHQKEQESLASVLQKLQLLLRPGSLVYLISDFHDFDEDCTKALTLMSKHNDLIAMHIQDPLEKMLPQGKKLSFTSSLSDEDQSTEIHGQHKATREQYQSYFEQQDKDLEQMLLQAGVPSYYINTGEDVHTQLQSGAKT